MVAPKRLPTAAILALGLSLAGLPAHAAGNAADGSGLWCLRGLPQAALCLTGVLALDRLVWPRLTRGLPGSPPTPPRTEARLAKARGSEDETELRTGT